MENLTPQQANELGKSFLAIGTNLGEFSRKYFGLLSDQEYRQLSALSGIILEYADDHFIESAQLVLDDARSSLTSIRKVTAQMKTTLETLKDVQKVIDIATTAVNLCKAIFETDPKGLANALSKLEDQLGG